MNLNINNGYVLRNVYYYDIGACHYNILKNFGIDISLIDKDNKEKRNIQIGKMMRDNKRISNILRETTNNIISQYILSNNLKDSDIIIRQYDGFISMKPLKVLDLSLPLELRHIFQEFIISIDGDKYIAIDEDKNIISKGIPNNYNKIIELYEEILNINFISKKTIFKELQKIRDKILFGDDIQLYAIPYDDEFSYINFKFYGLIKVSGSTFDMIDSNEIDKETYFDIYIKPFTKSLCFEFL